MAARKNRKGNQRAAATDEGTGLVRVRLTDEQWRARSDELASYIKKLEEVEGQKSAAAEKYNGEIKLLKEKISVLADEVDTHEANVEAQVAIDYDGYAGKRKRGQPANEADADADADAEPVVEGAA